MEQPTTKIILEFIKDIKAKIYNLTFSNGESFINANVSPSKPEVYSLARLEEITSSTLSILSKLYGEDNSHTRDFIEKNASYRKHITDPNQKILNCCLGKLKAAEADIQFGLLRTIEKEISGEVFGDFLKSAKLSLDNGFKEVAAVLSCAALEDLLKRLGKLNSLNIEDKTMSNVVNALKKVGIIKGAQSSLINAYVTVRNKTFHAEWDKIDKADIKSLISFTEEMLVKHFS